MRFTEKGERGRGHFEEVEDLRKEKRRRRKRREKRSLYIDRKSGENGK
jgi:hypothetical protein